MKHVNFPVRNSVYLSSRDCFNSSNMYIKRCKTMNTSDFFHQINLNFQAFISPCKLTFRLCFNVPFFTGNSNHAGFCVIEFYGSQIAANFLGQRRSVKSLSVFLRFLPHGAQQKENSYSLHDLNPKNQLPNIPANYLVLPLSWKK